VNAQAHRLGPGGSRCPGRGLVRVAVAPGYQADQFGLGQFARLPAGHVPAVAEHRHPVADVQHVFAAVGDDDAGDAVISQPGQQREQLAHLACLQVSGRLVEDDKPGARGQRPADRDQGLVGERKLADHLGVDWWTLGDGFTWESDDLDETAATNRHAWQVARGKLASGQYDLLILDELTYVVNYGWVPVDEVVDGVTGRWPKTNVVITGRDAPPELVEIADTVTEMSVVKHAYQRGITAVKGIEY